MVRIALAGVLGLLMSMHSIFAQDFLEGSIAFDGHIREYQLYVPASYDGTSSLPVLFNFHGGGGDIASQIAISDMRSIADTANFMLVYPQALPDPSDGGSTNWLQKEPSRVEDIFFINALIDTLSSAWPVDSNRIYACGYSLGGEFTFELACRLNEKIAAVGIVARTMGSAAFDRCTPVHPTAVLTILGTEDGTSPYGGLEWNGITFYLSAEDTHAYWVQHNQATTDPVVTALANVNTSDGSTVERYRWSGGTSCVSVEHLKVLGGGHDWPGSFGNMDIDASNEIWKFVSQFDLTGRMNCNTTGSSDGSALEQKVLIFPNPASAQLSIRLPQPQSENYQIRSLDGRLLFSGSLTSTTSINLSTLSDGLYLLEIAGQQIKFVKR